MTTLIQTFYAVLQVIENNFEICMKLVMEMSDYVSFKTKNIF